MPHKSCNLRYISFWLLFAATLLPALSANKCKDVDVWMNHEHAMKGYHVSCIVVINDELINIKLWSQIYTEAPITTFDHQIKDFDDKFSNIRSLLESNLETFQYTDKYRESYKLAKPNEMPSWSIFTTNGDKISNYESFITFINADNENNLLLIYEGGQFMYPGVEMNFIRSVSINMENNDEECLSYDLKTLSLKPLIFSVDNFININEQQSLLTTTQQLLATSQVENDTYSHWRTSSTAWINPSMKHKENEILSTKIAELTKVPIENQEDTQVLQYLESQHYGLHLDWFSDETNVHNKHNRLLTVLWYFNDVTDGGWTIFPMKNGKWIDKIYNLLSVQHCVEIGGLLVQPEKGKVVLFYNLEANGDTSNYSLHGSCPVGKGQSKYAANKWIWNVPYEAERFKKDKVT